jgi:hypothetical protein
MARKNQAGNETANSDDPEQLQMMDESNAEWVEKWKQTLKAKSKPK